MEEEPTDVIVLTAISHGAKNSDKIEKRKYGLKVKR